jgi:hypothetical protein
MNNTSIPSTSTTNTPQQIPWAEIFLTVEEDLNNMEITRPLLDTLYYLGLLNWTNFKTIKGIKTNVLKQAYLIRTVCWEPLLYDAIQYYKNCKT